MLDLNKIYLYRITHIENIPHILQYGITHSTSANANPRFVPIGDSSLITRRSNFLLNNGRHLGEYIPFYFSVRTPMLYVIQKGFNMVASVPAENIVYCVSSVKKMLDLDLDFVFTDGHAVEKFSKQYTKANINELENLIDWNAVGAKYWKIDTDLDLKRKKEAEFLVLGDIAAHAILGFAVSNENAKNRVIGLGADVEKVRILPDYYF